MVKITKDGHSQINPELFTFKRNGTQTSIHFNTRHALVIASFIGVFPVYGLCGRSEKLKFSWLSLKSIYTLALLIGIAIMEELCLQYTITAIVGAKLSQTGHFKKVTAGAIFYGTSLISCFFFLKLARNWSGFVSKWQELEMKRISAQQNNKNVKIITFTLLLFAIGEHGFHNWLNTTDLIKPANMGINDTNTFQILIPVTTYFERFAIRTHKDILGNENNYSLWKGLCISWISFSGTFLWNFNDLFIILVSYSLRNQFKSLNKKMKCANRKISSGNEWKTIRESYIILTKLVQHVDGTLSKFIFLSVANNIYFISVQFLVGIERKDQHIISTIFYIYSFGFLVCRTTLVLIYTAEVYEENKNLLKTISDCPSLKYSVEVKRLIMNMKGNPVYLTGLQLFPLTRDFLLAVYGAVITYEIILVQFYNVA